MWRHCVSPPRGVAQTLDRNSGCDVLMTPRLRRLDRLPDPAPDVDLDELRGELLRGHEWRLRVGLK